jgi:hypothetical protein
MTGSALPGLVVNGYSDRGTGSAQRDAFRVLCIGGTGQNGATLLTRMLGRVPGFVAVGELGYLWDRALVENMECGCGLPFRECPFWSRVGDVAFGGWDRVDPQEVLALRETLSLRGRHLPGWLSLPLALEPGLWLRYRDSVRRYAAFMARLYRGIARTAGKGIIIDSMKRPYHVYAVAGIPGIDLSLVHLVRDPRGVAYSGTKLVKRQGAIQGAYRARRSPLKSGIRWMWVNAAFEALPRRGIPATRVRYESLVRSPRAEIAKIVRSTYGIVEETDLRFIRDDEVDLASDHLVAGNRMRLLAGRIPLRREDEWRTGLSSRDQRTVSLVTWPLLRRYAYGRSADATSAEDRSRS